MEEDKLWETALAEIELNVSKANYNTWFKDTYIQKQNEGVVHLSVPNTFVRDWLQKKYHTYILKILRSLSDNVRSLEYVVSKSTQKSGSTEPKHIHSAGSSNHELPLSEHYINKDDNLNPRYTFTNFVVGPFNELAHAASQAIIKKPGAIYNPLFIYGNTGLGKTHLLQAVGNHIKQAFPNKKVFYLTSEKFVTEFVNALQNNTATQFKEKYRKYDLLIMDDIQFLAHKDKCQEELFHLFNELYDNNKQIVFSSDKHPNYIQNLEQRLKSRFSAGMIVDIPPPDHESRTAILQAKAEQNGLMLAKETLNHLASAITGSIRDLEGALNTISCQMDLKGKELTLSEVRTLLKDSAGSKRSLSAKEVIKTIAEFYNIEEETIFKKTRKKEVIKPRQVIMFLLREDFNISYPTIGEQLGGRDHTTVIHSCERVKQEMQTDNELTQEINEIRAMFR